MQCDSSSTSSFAAVTLQDLEVQQGPRGIPLGGQVKNRFYHLFATNLHVGFAFREVILNYLQTNLS